jgi:hypothetical protein
MPVLYQELGFESESLEESIANAAMRESGIHGHPWIKMETMKFLGRDAAFAISNLRTRTHRERAPARQA